MIVQTAHAASVFEELAVKGWTAVYAADKVLRCAIWLRFPARNAFLQHSSNRTKKQGILRYSRENRVSSVFMPELPENIALIHDWLTGMRGGEKCLEALCELFPRAPIYTLLGFPEKLSTIITRHPIRNSYLQRMPRIEKSYRHYLPLFPHAVESFDLSDFELIVSSSHAVAKGARPAPGALHISYVHTPMRYVWDMFDEYFPSDRVGALRRAFISQVARRLRAWDVRSAERVHEFIANSNFVRDRIRRFYGRDAAVIYPPVDTSRFHVSTTSEGYFLIVSALAPYKKIDLAVTVFNELGHPLRIIGDGPEKAALESIASKNVSIEGWADDRAVEQAYAGCRALIFPGVEDFGIVPVEAMASGKPVLAFRRGGATETVVENLCGAFFDEQSEESLSKAVLDFNESDYDAASIRKHAERFDTAVYMSKMDAFIRQKWADFTAGSRRS